MKKRLLILFIASLMVASAACTAENKDEKESSVVSDASSQVSAESKTESISSTDYLLMKSFGELWMCDTFYIDVNMSVEYDAVFSGDVSSSSKASETSLQTRNRTNYSFIIAVDRVNEIAGLNMMSDLGNQSLLLKDKYLYSIDHNSKTYTKKLYSGSADDFGSEYTTKILLGSVNNCVFEERGTTSFGEQQVTFEKYRVTASDTGSVNSSLGKVYTTYYFDSKQIPVAQIVETDTGKTTFTFNRISEQIVVPDILEIPEDYKEISG